MQNVSVRRLAVFCAVARHGSFIAAADALGISQPSVSDHIRLLEKNLGVTLFERHRGKVPQLTEAGKRLLAHSQALLAGLNGVRGEPVSERTPPKAVIRFACHRPIATAILPSALAQFARTYPGVELSVQAGTSEEVIKKVRGGSADVGMYLGNRAPAAAENIESAQIGQELFTFVVGTQHPLASQEHLAVEELRQWPFIRSDHLSQYAQDVSAMLANAGLTTTLIASRVTEFNTARALALQHVGVWCTLRRGVVDDVLQGRLTELHLQVPPLHMPLWLLCRQTNNDISEALQQFLREGSR